mmetsp:Transcript_3766/g.5136  ORF Transcript_3766/g.5136 Transcript_3766/m.5136 type:complete len:248 (+) Transcript_3766:5698-6441(+)
MVAESSFYNGVSKTSKFFHQLIEPMRVLQMKGWIHPHVIWVAGRRMIEQGTDGISRGDLNSGALVGKDFLWYVPLHKSILVRWTKSREWWNAVVPEGKAGKDWFWIQPGMWGDNDIHKNYEQFIWTCPPCNADVCVECLTEVGRIWPFKTHIFLSPAIMTPQWRKQLGKASDILINIVPGVEFWPWNMFEPLTFAVIFPLFRHAPWKAETDYRLPKYKISLPKMFREGQKVMRSSLQQLWDEFEDDW